LHSRRRAFDHRPILHAVLLARTAAAVRSRSVVHVQSGLKKQRFLPVSFVERRWRRKRPKTA
jgi:hypothetical protein